MHQTSGDDHRAMGMSELTATATAALATVALAAPGALGATLVSVNAGGAVLRVRPASIHLVSNENLGQLKWKSWGAATAHGTGTSYANGPSPHHAASNPVAVELRDRRNCGTHAVYTTISLRFTASVPYAGMSKSLTYRYGCPHR
jgi:hypothetical protein